MILRFEAILNELLLLGMPQQKMDELLDLYRAMYAEAYKDGQQDILETMEDNEN